MSHTRPEYSRIIATRALISGTAIAGMLILGMGLPEQAHSGSLEPSGPPAPTMRTLDQVQPVWDQKLDSTNGSAVVGREGCDSDRFSCLWGDTVVRDNETGLVWERSPLATTHTWVLARSECTSRTVGGRIGWRLPSVHELASLVDPTNPGGNPDLPASHPFTNIQSPVYWSATTEVEAPTTRAWNVNFAVGVVADNNKATTLFVWCVRGGNNADAY